MNIIDNYPEQPRVRIGDMESGQLFESSGGAVSLRTDEFRAGQDGYVLCVSISSGIIFEGHVDSEGVILDADLHVRRRAAE